MFEIFRLELLLLVMGIVLVSGLAICMISTYFVVNKLVSLKKDSMIIRAIIAMNAENMPWNAACTMKGPRAWLSFIELDKAVVLV